MKKLDNLLEKDLHIVEKRKILFAIPLAIIVVAIVTAIIFNFTLGSPFNLGTDFTGGYSIDVKLGNRLTDDNYNSYCRRIEDVLSTVTTEDGKEYSVRIDNMQRQGSGDSTAIHVKYHAVKGVSEAEMIDVINPAIKSELEDEILMLIPAVATADKTVTLTYNEIISAPTLADLKNTFVKLAETLNADNNAGMTFDGDAADSVKLDENDSHKVVISFATINASSELDAALASGMKISDKYAGSVTQGDLIGATVSTELLFNAVLAVSLALIFMLCYIGIRFQLSSGLACIIALLHDILIMFSFMAICRIEINSTFIAALITILG